MPTQTFFNLPDKKREKLMDAVRDEFSRVPLDQVSINKIVQAAGIARGSFYQYFESKRDVLVYLLSDYKRMVFAYAIEALDEGSGDLFAMCAGIFDFVVAFVTEEPMNGFCSNLLADVRVHMGLFALEAHKDDMSSFLSSLRAHVNMDLLDTRRPEDFDNMVGAILPILGQALAETFFDASRRDIVRKRYLARLQLMARGFTKNKEAEGQHAGTETH